MANKTKQRIKFTVFLEPKHLEWLFKNSPKHIIGTPNMNEGLRQLLDKQIENEENRS